MKEGLVRIKQYYYDDEEEYVNIEELKIYYDSISGQYKHHAHCCCGKDLGCWCYDDLDDARYDIDIEGFTCDDCFIEECIEEGEDWVSIMEDPDIPIGSPCKL